MALEQLADGDEHERQDEPVRLGERERALERVASTARASPSSACAAACEQQRLDRRRCGIDGWATSARSRGATLVERALRAVLGELESGVGEAQLGAAARPGRPLGERGAHRGGLPAPEAQPAAPARADRGSTGARPAGPAGRSSDAWKAAIASSNRPSRGSREPARRRAAPRPRERRRRPAPPRRGRAERAPSAKRPSHTSAIADTGEGRRRIVVGVPAVRCGDRDRLLGRPS